MSKERQSDFYEAAGVLLQREFDLSLVGFHDLFYDAKPHDMGGGRDVLLR